jgi:16S rRNA (guanine527-N7)-methyltransferase
MDGSRRDARLEEVLLESQQLGFLGPGPVDEHLRHSQGFVDVAQQALPGAPAIYVDLGTGGGVPGLFCALAWPNAQVSLIDANVRRCAALRAWIPKLGLAGRVSVVEGRAEESARATTFRERADVVTARGLAAPAPTAEIGAAFTRMGGILVVSDPPEQQPLRWPPEPLAELGFAATSVEVEAGHYAVLRKESPLPERFPRAVGRPAKRPLW